MSLYDEAAVALIAEGAAGKDGVLYNIKPEEKLKATELVTNGSFTGSDGWALDAGGQVSIAGGKLVFTDAVGTDYKRAKSASTVFEDGKKYKISFSVTDFLRSSTGIKVRVQEDDNKNIIDVEGNGNFSAIYEGQATEEIQFKVVGGASDTLSCKIDNVSVKEVEQEALDFTFTRGSNLTATRVGPSGYIEKGRENLFTQSNEFDGDDWDPQNLTVTSGQSGYDGSINAFKLTVEVGESGANVGQDFTQTGVKTFSVYAKGSIEDGTTGLRFFGNESGGSNNVSVFFVLTGDGSIYGTPNNVIDTNIEKIGSSGWYRCSVTFDKTLSKAYIYVSNGAGGNFTDDTDGADTSGTGSILIQNAQVEVGLVATDYIESGSTTGKAGILEDSPRFDYTGGGCPHLLMEPTRVNYFAHSEYLAGTFGTINSTFTANADKSPEGVDNATSVLESTANAAHGLQKIDIDIEDGVFYSYSFFVKAKGRTKFLVQHSEETTMNTSVTVDLSGTPSVTEGRPAATGSQSIVDYGNGWYRVEINGKEGLADDADSNLNIFFHNGSGTSYTGDATKGFLFYGFQIEKKHFCTSYIPNHGTSAGVTRNEDDTNTIDLSDYMDGEDITWYVELAKNDELIRDGSTTGIRLSTTDLNASSVKFYRSYAGAPDGIRTVVYFADGENDNDPASHQITEAGPVKVIVRRVKSTGEFTIFYDGAQKYQAFAPANYGKLKTLKIDGEKQPLFINNMFLFDRALTDDECIALTT